MSTWYQLEVHVIAEDDKAIAKFLNINVENVRTDHIEFSFGQKNGPGINLEKIAEQNPDLIFLVSQSIECDTHQWWLQRFDRLNNQHQYIEIQDIGYISNEINKKILEEYTKEFPTLPAKHLANEKGYEGFRWTMFFYDFNKCAVMLSNSNQYKEMVSPITSNDDFIDNDFSHLMLDDE